jgi:HPt (histidine-containing phosphotransfer) domain-containing protein
MEKPNLQYVDSLARGDESVRKILINTIKMEFPKEKEDFYISLKKKDYKKIEENVHRIKHKISILGLVKSYEKANEFEHNLREKSISGFRDFEKTLISISEYIKTM